MNTKTPTSNNTNFLNTVQQATHSELFPNIDSVGTSTSFTFQEMLEEFNASLSEPEVLWSRLVSDACAAPSTIQQSNLADSEPQAVRWLWEQRLPLAGITLLDGDHGCGKSLLSLQIAAHVSSGTSLPDGTPTLQGGVVIVTPNTDATPQLQLLTALGADLSRIEILSSIQEPTPSPDTEDSHLFSLPDDFTHLFSAIQRVNARLVIFDPFISLLSREHRWSETRLSHLLADLNQQLIKRNVACLLIRNCPAKGGHARPPSLERSDYFVTTSISRLLLAPDPMQPDRLLLSHAGSYHSALNPTLMLQIEPHPTNPDLPHIRVLGSHQLSAHDLMANHPDTLHRRLLFQHLNTIIAVATTPIHVATLYSRCPNSSPTQIQRTLRDLLNMGQIASPERGFYAPTPANPVFSPNITAAKTSTPKPKAHTPASTTTTHHTSEPVTHTSNTNPTTIPTTEPINTLNTNPTTKSSSEPANTPNTNPAINPPSELVTIPKLTATTNHAPQPTNTLNTNSTTTHTPQPVANTSTSNATKLHAQTPKRARKKASKRKASQTKKRRRRAVS